MLMAILGMYFSLKMKSVISLAFLCHSCLVILFCNFHGGEKKRKNDQKKLRASYHTSLGQTNFQEKSRTRDKAGGLT